MVIAGRYQLSGCSRFRLSIDSTVRESCESLSEVPEDRMFRLRVVEVIDQGYQISFDVERRGVAWRLGQPVD